MLSTVITPPSEKSARATRSSARWLPRVTKMSSVFAPTFARRLGACSGIAFATVVELATRDAMRFNERLGFATVAQHDNGSFVRSTMELVRAHA